MIVCGLIFVLLSVLLNISFLSTIGFIVLIIGFVLLTFGRAMPGVAPSTLPATGTVTPDPLAQIHSIVSNGGEVDGVRFLSPRTIELIFDQQSDRVDLALGLPVRFGIGYGLPHSEVVPYVRAGCCCFGWDGEGPLS